MLPPIIIFAFNRPDKLAGLIDSLRRNKGVEQHEIFVFIDGPRNENDRPKIEECQRLAAALTQNVSVASTNQGLAKSVIKGVSEIVNRFGNVIVLEDDLILHPLFLSYMRQGLENFKNDPRVLSVCGFGLNITPPKGYSHDIYLSTRSSSWGWATWSDRWNKIDWDVKDFSLLQQSSSLRKEFNSSGSDMYAMLKNYMEGKNNSWAIRFCFHQFRNHLYSVHPFKSLVINNGYGAEASNCRQTYSRFKIEQLPADSAEILFTDPQELLPDRRIDRQLRRYHSIPIRIYSKIRALLHV